MKTLPPREKAQSMPSVRGLKPLLRQKSIRGGMAALISERSARKRCSRLEYQYRSIAAEIEADARMGVIHLKTAAVRVFRISVSAITLPRHMTAPMKITIGKLALPKSSFLITPTSGRHAKRPPMMPIFDADT